MRWSVQHHSLPESGELFARQMRSLETAGCGSVLFADHYNDRLSPLPAMMAAASATTSLRVGSMVLANDYRHPVEVANQTATIDLLSGGRAELGIGAGWMRSDYQQLGISFDPAAERIDRLIEAVQIIRACWSGDPVSIDGEHYRVTDHRTSPVPHPTPKIRIGGGGPRMLQLAAVAADIVSLNPRHRDNAANLTSEGRDMTLDAVADRVHQIRAWAAAGPRPSVDIEIPIRVAKVTDDPRPALDAMREILGLTQHEAAASPYLAIGPPGAIAEKFSKLETELGIDRWVVMENDVDDLLPILAKSSGNPAPAADIRPSPGGER